MTERGSAPVERATACPFVAFEDDRDERSERPDRRHRCYAELHPAPRAIAHQEAYCLSPGFPACPTFQDWARREAAKARRSAEEAAAGSAAATGAAVAGAAAAGPVTPVGELAPAGEAASAREAAPAGVAAASGHASEQPEPDPVTPAEGPSPSGGSASEEPWADDARRFRPRPANRKWAAPPPWAGSSAVAAAASSDDGPGERSEATGLAASRWLADGSGGPDRARSAGNEDTPGFLAGRTADADDHVDAAPGRELAAVVPRSRRPVARDATSRSAAAGERSTPRKPVIGQARPVAHVEHDDGTPSWERPRRFEAYPTLKRRVGVGMPAMSRLTIGAIALVVAALLLLTLPGLWFGGANQEARTTPSPSALRSASASPAAPAAPTPLTYTVRPGDTLARIATKFGVTQNKIMAANPTIKDPDKIVIGQVIVIPTRGPSDVIVSGPSGSPSPSG